MATAYNTGPAWIYVGIPVSNNVVIPPPAPVSTLTSGGGRTPIGPIPAGLSGGGRIVNLRRRREGGRLLSIESRAVPYFLGTAEVSPEFDLEPRYLPYHSDLGGDVETDLIFAGEGATIRADLTRWNEPVLAAISSRPVMYRGRGVNSHVDIGGMVVRNRLHHVVWVVWPYAVKAPYRLNGLPPCYRFPACALVGPDRNHAMGTRPRKVHLTWRALRRYDRTLRAFFLYDHDVSGLPEPN